MLLVTLTNAYATQHSDSPYCKLIVELSALARCFDICVEFHECANQIGLNKRMIQNLKKIVNAIVDVEQMSGENLNTKGKNVIDTHGDL